MIKCHLCKLPTNYAVSVWKKAVMGKRCNVKVMACIPCKDKRNKWLKSRGLPTE